MEEKETKEFILKELSRFNFKKYTKGFRYLAESIFLCVKDIEAIDNLHKNVFPFVAERHKEKSANNVKWCIEQSIKTMYNNTEIKKISNYFNIEENTKPSLKLIIYTVVSKHAWNEEKY